MSLSDVFTKFQLYVSYGLSIAVHLALLVSLWDFGLFMWDQDSYHCLMRSCNVHKSWKHRTVDLMVNWNAIPFLLVDVSLLVLFMLSHSLRLPQFIKRIIPQHLSRAFYVLTTATTIECLICWWVRIPEVSLWKCDIGHSGALWWLFAGIAGFCWMLIYGECLMMDMLEVIGLKQVHYRSIGMGDPLSMKTDRLQEFFQHMRHPGFTAFTVILWCHPWMTLDRLLMAVIFTFYMLMRFPVTLDDYQYQRQQMRTKFKELLSTY